MKVFRILRAAPGIILWTGPALDALAALDTMAHAAGYHDRARLPDRLHAADFTSRTSLSEARKAPGRFRRSGCRSCDENLQPTQSPTG